MLHLFLGGMAERLKAADLKSVDVKASVGSNPTSSATFYMVVAQSGSASGLGPEGRGFESLLPYHFKQVRQIRLAAPDCKSGTFGFAGSNPAACTTFNCRNSVTVARESPKLFVRVQILLAAPLFMHL